VQSRQATAAFIHTLAATNRMRLFVKPKVG
jgi:hypothetical protein